VANGMVERFNGRIANGLKPHRLGSAQDMAQALTQCVALYNHQFPPSALEKQDADADHERVVGYPSTPLSQAFL
jgi:transposase InsO family protein